jgi:hypothetical protein
MILCDRLFIVLINLKNALQLMIYLSIIIYGDIFYKVP